MRTKTLILELFLWINWDFYVWITPLSVLKYNKSVSQTFFLSNWMLRKSKGIKKKSSAYHLIKTSINCMSETTLINLKWKCFIPIHKSYYHSQYFSFHTEPQKGLSFVNNDNNTRVESSEKKRFQVFMLKKLIYQSNFIWNLWYCCL
jgi:hypothetical protein